MHKKWLSTLAGLMAFVTLVMCPIGHVSAQPISLHPENPHYFEWKGKPTILVTSGEHYGAVLNLAIDYAAYLDELHAHGLNLTRTFSGTYREVPNSFGITDNPLAPEVGQYICPWPRTDLPGESDGGTKFDLTRWNEKYFQRLKDFLSEAAKRDVIVEFNLFCPMYKDELWKACPMNTRNNINDVGNCPREEVYTGKRKDLLDVQLAFTRKIVEELKDFDNLYYEVCNEPYFGGVTMDWQRLIVDEIVAGEANFPHKHLISMNIANGRQKVENPPLAVSIFNFHYCIPPDTVGMNYELNKVIGENETGFRGSQDILYRTEGWDFLLAGGALYNNLDYSFTPKTPDGSMTDYKSPGGGSRELRVQLGILKTFLEGFDFVHMQPDDKVVVNVSDKLSVHVLSQPGKAYAAYLHVPLPNKPKDLASLLRDDVEATLRLALSEGSYTVTWFDPKTGKTIESRQIKHAGGELTLNTPRFENDLALKFVRR
jgi:hypothetical protein